MAHPILRLLVRRPGLVAEHAAGYAALVHEEASALGGELAGRAIAWVLTALGLLVFLVTAGVAVMLGVMLGEFHLVLVAVPGTFLLLSVAAWTVARRPLPAPPFAQVKEQFAADTRALHEVAARS
jgi:hypothetical protein